MKALCLRNHESMINQEIPRKLSDIDTFLKRLPIQDHMPRSSESTIFPYSAMKHHLQRYQYHRRRISKGYSGKNDKETYYSVCVRGSHEISFPRTIKDQLTNMRTAARRRRQSAEKDKEDARERSRHSNTTTSSLSPALFCPKKKVVRVGPV